MNHEEDGVTEEEGLYCMLTSAFPAVVALFFGLLSRSGGRQDQAGSYFGKGGLFCCYPG